MMALRQRVKTLFARRERRHSRAPQTHHGSVTESTLEAMFAYQHELSRTIPRQRRSTGRR